MPSMPRLPLLAATTLLAAAPVWADTLYTLPGATGQLATDTSVTASFSAGAGAGQAVFTVQGYNTLDGDNYYIDILHVTLNGTEVFSGTWDLGGGGTNRVLLDPNGATVGAISNQQLTITLPVTFTAGTNQLVFTYASPGNFENSGRAGFQGIGDESWGLNAASVTGVSPVPEPNPAALMLGGLAALGWLAKRRSNR